MMMGYGFGAFGWLFMIIFWVVVIGLGIWLAARIFPQVTSTLPSMNAEGQNQREESALEIIKRRYAQGEISEAEYEEMRRTLSN